MKETTFTIEHDDQPNDVVYRIAGALSILGFDIKELEGGDGFQEYKIVKIDE